MSVSCLAPCAQEPSQASPRAASHPKPPRAASASTPVPAVPAVPHEDRFEKLRKPTANVAVLLNAQARKVTPRIARRLERIVGTPHAFYSHSLEEARAHIATIAAGGYDTLVCCGGDGTLITAMNMMRAHIDSLPAPVAMPRFAQLTLGTGNALRQVVRAGQPVADLRAIHAGQSVDRQLSLIEDHTGTAFFFAGIGHDALLMHDYDAMQRHVPKCVSRNVLRSKVGFTAALLSLTAPHLTLNRNHGKAVVEADGPCFRIDRANGDALVPLAPGEIFSGDIGTLGVSTVPWLGYDIRMFPFADTVPELMHLRITQMSLAGMLAHSKSLWRGTYNHPTRCHDFLVTAVDIRLDRELHYQHSGESQGRVSHVRFGVRPNAITMAAQPEFSRRPKAALLAT